MNDLIINVEKSTRMVLLTKTTIGNEFENLQEKFIFKFTDTFVDGQGRLEYKMGTDKNYIVLTKENDTYTIPVQNVLTQEGKIEMQLVITEGTEEENIPVFKSNVFYLYCNKSINAVDETPEGYDLWIEQANAKLNAMDEALAEVDNLDIDATKSGDTATISITNKEGTTKSVEIKDGTNGRDGRDGIDGKDAKINGINTISIEAGNNVSLEQEESILTINAVDTTDYTSFTNKPSINDVILSGNKTTSDLGLGTITSVKMNGSTVATSGEADLGTVITDISSKQDVTDNTLQTTNKTVPSAINEVNSIAKGANQAIGYANYSTMVTAINAMDDDEFTMGQNIYIVTVNVPDLWVSSVESTSSTYTYVDDATIVSALETNGYIQVGYYKLSMLETQKVDLTNYVTNTDYATSSIGGVVKVSNGDYGLTVDEGVLKGTVKNYSQYGDASSKSVVTKGTLENVITGKGLVSNTDYASTDTGGVVKMSSTTGAKTNASGLLYCDNKSYSDYGSASNYLFVSKGTLENVITGKALVSNTDYASSSAGGVVKPSANYGSQVASSGIFYGSTRTYQQYSDGNSNVLICKGTLENVFTERNILPIVTLTQADYDALVSAGTVDANTYYYIEE